MIYTEKLETFNYDFQLVINEEKDYGIIVHYFKVNLTKLGLLFNTLNLLSPTLCKNKLFAKLEYLHFDRKSKVGVSYGQDLIYSNNASIF